MRFGRFASPEHNFRIGGNPPATVQRFEKTLDERIGDYAVVEWEARFSGPTQF
jgi:hypothetical protein